MTIRPLLPACLALFALGAAEPRPIEKLAEERLDGSIVTEAGVFASWADYVKSDFFAEQGRKCGLPQPELRQQAAMFEGSVPSDCTYTFTNPDPVYDPNVAAYVIPVVVHVIQNTSGSGFISEAGVRSQIDILNEDFLALAGTNGGNGLNVQLQFRLATEDPSGDPTNGITYSTNNTWFNDGGSYWNSLAWDTNRYLNIYTNSASGALGYVPDLPQGGIAGSNSDRVVILWSSFGRNGPIGPPFNQGRTATHEVGHYFGLEHTFTGGCASPSTCYSNGDYICDTNPQSSPTSGCGGGSSCGSPDPTDNYMDYSNDICMERFTSEQARRMRCSLENYRENLFELASDCGNGTVETGEECDDGNEISGDGCDRECRFENTCGDSVIEPGEECDDGNTLPGDGCDENCQLGATCGNEVVEEPETCDPPNTPTCDASCRRFPFCGDGAVDSGEECDDGNGSSGDGCTAYCQFEGPEHDCCSLGHGSGCNDPSIQACVCAQDSFCCNSDWDNQCVTEVQTFGCGECNGSQPGEISGPSSLQPLTFSDAETLVWEPSGLNTFNVYRGVIEDVRSGNYGLCFLSDLSSSTAGDSASPSAGGVFTYLVAGQNGLGEGTLGLTSTNEVRTTSDRCP